MPEIVADGVVNGEAEVRELNGIASPYKESPVPINAPKRTLSPQGPEAAAPNHTSEDVVDTSIEKLYENVCDMQSSDQSPSRRSFGSDGDESRIDSELHHLVGGQMREVEIMEEEVAKNQEDDLRSASSSKKESSSTGKNSGKAEATQSASPRSISNGKAKKVNQPSLKSSPGTKIAEKPLMNKRIDKLKQQNKRQRNRADNSSEAKLDNPDLGPFLLKQARDLISSGDNLQKALELALQAAKSFEIRADGKPSLELVMCLHVTAAIYCSLGQYDEAIPVLERSIEIPNIEEGQEHALAKFAGHMQLGDTYAMLGQLEKSSICYKTGLELQQQVLGEKDPRVGETCRYVAEALVQALQFDEAQRICQMALDIHKENSTPASLVEAADRRLMGLICEIKGDHEAALEHLVLASMAMVANGEELEMATVDCSIGDTYLSLTRYDEAAFAYQKALAVFKTTKGENHPAVASVLVRLADLYNRTGKLREANSYCENALRIYEKPMQSIPPEEIASGFTDVSAICESMNELDQALKLLEKALQMYNNAPGQQTAVAGVEAQMGVIQYMLGNYSESYNSLKNAIAKLRASGEKKSAFFGIALNQMGLACVQRYSINEAVELFEEARLVLEHEYGPYHPDTLGVYSNLAGTYDAIGRVDDAIELLEYVVGMREEKLGTAHPDVDDEKKRLGELLKETGRGRSKKGRSLENLLDAHSRSASNGEIKQVSVKVSATE